ncbi:MAG TPA: phosphoribosylanthranilate isomerase [Candidatus Dormibacteraeota bacterium]|nr:phosphoribosylanthranilate isomerase [Candidatus Dormibacteraeota bacterium]
MRAVTGVRVKICGTTSVADALLAVEAGADAIGLNFYEPSPRYLSLDRAQAIAVAVAGAIDRIGVFMHADPAELNRVVRAVGLDAVQVHAPVTRALAAALDCPCLPAVALHSLAQVATLDWWPALPVLLDSAGSEGAGGTGRAVDWGLAATVARHRPVWLAGGLGPETVARAIAEVRPEAVDAVSALERAPGVKDPERVRAFVRAARAAAADPAVAAGIAGGAGGG